MFIHGHISLKNYTTVFYAVLGEKVLKPRLIILKGRFTSFGLNRRYSVLFGLTDNLFDFIHENTALIQDSIVEKADEASSGENDK